MHRKGSADLQGVWPDFFLIHPSINLSILFNLSLLGGGGLSLSQLPSVGRQSTPLALLTDLKCKRVFFVHFIYTNKKTRTQLSLYNIAQHFPVHGVFDQIQQSV